MTQLRAASPYLLAGLLAGAGGLHFVMPGPYDGLIPSWLPGPPRWWVYGSGLAEIACGAGLVAGRTRRVAATATAVLLVVVFVGNVEMALDPGDTPRWLVLARLPLQVPLVLWALQVRRGARPVSAADAR